MTASLVSVALDNTSDATFRAWCQAIDTALLTTFGWTQSSDTGQVSDMTTLVKPAIGSGVYRIYKMADSLQATSPFYMKVEFFNGSASALPRLKVTVGTGSNGTGTLTGNTSTQVDLALGSNDTTARNCYFSGSTDRFTMWMGQGNTSVQWFFSVSRLTNSSNARTGDGVMIASGYANSATNFRSQVLGSVVGSPGVQTQVSTNFPGIVPRSPAGCSSSTGFGIFPCLPVVGRAYSPIFEFGITSTTDLLPSMCLTFSAYSSTYTWMPTKISTESANYYIAMRYD